MLISDASERQNRPRQNRLIVLLPESLAGNLELARKIFWMAIRDHNEVVYLALVDNEENSLSVRRSMVTMNAITAGESLAVWSKIVQTNCWLVELRAMYLPGDLVVCHEEQMVKIGYFKTAPINTFLQNNQEMAFVTLSGFYNPQHDQVSHWLRVIVAWLGFLLILVGFTTLEIRLDGLVPGAYGKVALGIVLLFEIGAIWAWNLIAG